MDAHSNKDALGSPETPTALGQDLEFAHSGRDDDWLPGKAGTDGSGGHQAGDSKLKKKTKWRWRWKQKENRPAPEPQFSHNPPGHTCGLPCCNHDNDAQPMPQSSSQRGCVPVPGLAQAELCESNFFMRPTPIRSMGRAVGFRRSQSDNLGLVSGEEARAIGVTTRVDKLSRSHGSIPIVVLGASPQPAGSIQVRQRCITLPGCSQAQHKMMFLNHQPGETSDYGEAGYLVTNVLRAQETGDGFEPSSGVVRSETMGRQSPAVELVREVTDSKGSQGSGTRGKRLVHSKLPDVPIEDTAHPTGMSEVKMTLLGVEEDGDNASAYGDHVYDVLSEVKDSALKLSQILSAQLRPDVDQQDNVSELTSSDIDSVTYQDSVIDSLADSHYIYSGSLLSENIDDTDSSTRYPDLTTKHFGDFDYPVSQFRYGSKSKYLNSCILGRLAGKTSGSLRSSNMEYGSADQLFKGNNSVGLDIDNMNNQVSELGSNLKHQLAAGEERRNVKHGSKLRLWDLRMLTLNREGNHYSTFPLRKLTSDDVSVGHFTRTRELGYLHRHHSDVSTDHYFSHKLERILRSPVPVKRVDGLHSTLHWVDYSQLNPFKDKSSLYYGHDDLFKSRNVDELTVFDDWKHIFQEKQNLADWGSISDFPAIQRHPWTTDSVCPQSGPHSSTSDASGSIPVCLASSGQLTAPGQEMKTRSVSSDHGSSSCHATDRPRHAASNVMTFSNLCSRDRDRPQVMFLDECARSRDVTARPESDVGVRSGSVAWRTGRLVDWRRQAEVYRDKNLITLIL